MKLSEATLKWEQWRRKRWLRRRVASWTAVSVLAALLVTAGALRLFGPVFNVGEKGEAVLVKLGNPEGEDLPLSVSAVPDQAMQAVMTAQRDTALNTVEETRASDPDPEPAAVPVAKPKPDPQPKTASPAKPADKPVPKPAPANPPTDKPAVTEKVIRGSEKGNSSELILKPQGDKISQNAYWPVYLFMPLPAKVDAGLLARVKATALYTADERRDVLLQFYAKAADGLALGSQPPMEVRPVLWEILEGAGYDVANADYKKDGTLKPVVLSFKLGVPKGNADTPDLTDVRLEQSSGNGPVDEAVLYAFRKSTFANGTGQVAQGRYTYDFRSKR